MFSQTQTRALGNPRTRLFIRNSESWFWDSTACSLIAAYWLLLGYANPHWTFSAPGWLDPWYYVGYGYNLTDATFESENYKISRMPWLVVQFVFRTLFQDASASLVIATVPFILMTIATYLYLRCHYAPLISLATASSIVLFIPAMLRASGGADYHALFSAGCVMLGFAMWSRVSQKSRTIGLILISIGLHANIVAVNLVPLLAIAPTLDLISQDVRKAPALRAVSSLILKVIGNFVAVFLLVTTALSGLSLALNRPALFFLPQFRLAQSFVSDTQNQTPWWQPWSLSWVWSSPLLVLSVVTVLTFSLGAILRPKERQADETNAVAWFTGLVFTVILWSFWQTIGHTAWQPSYFSVPVLVPLLFTVVFWSGLVVSRVVAGTSLSVRRIFLGTLFLCFTLPLFGVGLEALADIGSTRSGIESSATFIAFVAVAAYSIVRFAPAAPLVGSLGLVFVLFALPTTQALGPSAFEPLTPGTRRCIPRQEAFHWIVASHKLLASFSGGTDQVIIWFDESQNAQIRFCDEDFSIASLGYSLVSTGFRYAQWPPWPMASIEDVDIDLLASSLQGDVKSRLVLLTQRNSGASANELAIRLGLATRGARTVFLEEMKGLPDGPSMWLIQLG